MTNSLFKAAVMSSVFLLCALETNATTLYIKNNDTAKVDVTIEPENDKIISSSASIKQVLNPGEEKIVTLNQEIMENADKFNVKGSVKVPSPYGKCSLLKFSQNYKITFTGGDLGGVVCNSEVVSLR